MSCSCQGDVSIFSNSETRTSRKDRRCEECHGSIPKGSRYVYQVGKSQRGSFWNFVICLACDSDWSRIRSIFYDASDEACACLGNLEENISEAVDRGYLESTDPLAIKWLETLEIDDSPENAPPVEHYFCTDESQMSLCF
jgi:hypothetical protein